MLRCGVEVVPSLQRVTLSTFGDAARRVAAKPLGGAAVNFMQRRGYPVVTMKVPEMGDSILSGRLQKYLKKKGDYVAVDEIICSIETDKIVVEPPSKDAGVITETLAQEGAEVKVGDPLCKIDTDAKAPAGGAPKKEEPKKEAPKADAPKKEAPKAEAPKAEAPKDKPKDKPASPAAPAPAAGSRTDTRVPTTRVRQTIAKRLMEARSSMVMVTTFQEIDMFEAMNLRKVYGDAFAAKHGIKLGLMSIFAKAATAALQEQPVVNASMEGDEIVYHNYTDISVAVAGPTGLVVPVIRNTHTMSFAEIEKAIASYGQKAKDGKLTKADMTGGTFTISNGGVFGSLFGTPVVNPPQSAVLGIHAIFKKPWVVGDKIEIRPIMVVCLTYDHRLIDGREAVLFLKKVKTSVEDPRTLLIDV